MYSSSVGGVYACFTRGHNLSGRDALAVSTISALSGIPYLLRFIHTKTMSHGLLLRLLVNSGPSLFFTLFIGYILQLAERSRGEPAVFERLWIFSSITAELLQYGGLLSWLFGGRFASFAYGGTFDPNDLIAVVVAAGVLEFLAWGRHRNAT